MRPWLVALALLCALVGCGCVAFGLRLGLWDNRGWRLAVWVWAVMLAAWVVLALSGR